MTAIPPSFDDEDDRLFPTYDFSLPDSSEGYTPTPEQQQISLALRDQYLQALERSKQIRQEERMKRQSAP